MVYQFMNSAWVAKMYPGFVFRRVLALIFIMGLVEFGFGTNAAVFVFITFFLYMVGGI